VLIGRRYELEKRIVSNPDGLNQHSEAAGQNVPQPDTAERLAAEYQIDEKTVRRAGEFVQGLDALATVREDLPTAVLTKKSQRETKGLAQGLPDLLRQQAPVAHTHPS
jgi:hypothetical protein